MARGLKSRDRKGQTAADVQLFVQRYGRKARAGGLDSNDRDYDHRVENVVRQLKPEQFDALLRDGGDE
jgi:hypothetical protein